LSYREVVPREDRADVRCVLCGEQLAPPLVDPTLLSVQRAETFETLETVSFLVHPECLRRAAHPALRADVSAKLDRQA
jgi:hypothetical protein